MGILEVRDKQLQQIVSEEAIRKRAGGFVFIEGAVWSPHATVIFSDIIGNKMYEFDPSTGEATSFRDPSNMANGNVYDREGRLITCEHATSRVVRLELDGTMTVLAANYGGTELLSPNDVVVDMQGRIVFTDPPYGRLLPAGIPRPFSQPVQGVYRVDPRGGSIERLADDFDRPNGLCFAGEESVLFVNDSARMHIRRFGVEGSGLTGGEVWAELKGSGKGAPDGMKVDSRGNLFCCGPGGVHVFSRDGRCLGVIQVPEEVANFNWGDDDLMTLYLCASTSLYSCRVLVPGETR